MALCPGKNQFLSNQEDMTDKDYQRLMVFRTRKALGAEEELEQAGGIIYSPVTDNNIDNLKEILEKVNEEPDFQPSSFLSIGAEKARAICRIRVPGGCGTGFLVGKGILMTNHHVLDGPKTAADSIAEFHYEKGEKKKRVALDPDTHFTTNKELDFTLVACKNPEELADIKPLNLSKDPTLVTRYERLNIIQHPAGRQKEIAIRNNKVERIKEVVIHYRTDTEPGSSGSPVFNDEWELVALHHAGWFDDVNNKKAINEGIRISAIISHLEANKIEFEEQLKTAEPEETGEFVKNGDNLSSLLNPMPMN